MYQYGRLGKIFYFGFGTNDASGNHSAAAPSQCFVRRVGASADAAPLKTSVSAVHLVGTGYPTGCFEVQITAAGADGFSAGERYLVFAHASASGLSTVACIGGFELSAQIADVVTIDTNSVSAALSAIVYVANLSAMRAVGVTSANAVSVAAAAALADYDVPTSADVSVIVANGPSGSGVSSAQVSAIVAGVLADYDVPTSADVSAIVDTVSMTSASVSSLVRQVLIDYDVPTSADVSVLVSTIGFIAATSALRAVGVASANAVSVAAAAALADYDVPTSSDVSTIARTALVDRQVPTSAQLSVQIADGWRVFTLAEPGAIPDFSSCTPASALAWLVMLSKNRMTQTSALTKVQTSAGAEFASASVSDDGTTFIRGPWVS
jgi:hypothetical protein